MQTFYETESLKIEEKLIFKSNSVNLISFYKKKKFLKFSKLKKNFNQYIQTYL